MLGFLAQCEKSALPLVRSPAWPLAGCKPLESKIHSHGDSPPLKSLLINQEQLDQRLEACLKDIEPNQESPKLREKEGGLELGSEAKRVN